MSAEEAQENVMLFVDPTKVRVLSGPSFFLFKEVQIWSQTFWILSH